LGASSLGRKKGGGDLEGRGWRDELGKVKKEGKKEGKRELKREPEREAKGEAKRKGKREGKVEEET
jgi:hypothetical protein